MKMHYMRITGKYQGERASVIFSRKGAALTGPWDVSIEFRGFERKFHCGKDIRPCPTHATMLLDFAIRGKELRGNLKVRPFGAQPRLAS